jgi:hypothetical protein
MDAPESTARSGSFDQGRRPIMLAVDQLSKHMARTISSPEEIDTHPLRTQRNRRPRQYQGNIARLCISGTVVSRVPPRGMTRPVTATSAPAVAEPGCREWPRRAWSRLERPARITGWLGTTDQTRVGRAGAAPDRVCFPEHSSHAASLCLSLARRTPLCDGENSTCWSARPIATIVLD